MDGARCALSRFRQLLVAVCVCVATAAGFPLRGEQPSPEVKYLGSGWEVRAPLTATTNQRDEIVKIDTFPTAALNPKKNHDSAKIRAKECALPPRTRPREHHGTSM